MRKLLLLGLCLWSAFVVNGQQLTYEFDYDLAGNRVRRTVVQLNNGDALEKSIGEIPDALSEIMSDGKTMRLYPNPTTESIRFELDGNQKIGKFVLSDINGKPIKTGLCENSSLTLDLTTQSKGMYLLELFIDDKPYFYKIIKQ